jgi:hypothetical protein
LCWGEEENCQIDVTKVLQTLKLVVLKY